MRLLVLVGILLVLTAILFAVGSLGSAASRAQHAAQKGARAKIELGQKIVDAIEYYRHEVGHPPASLTNLVPKYLKSLPDTNKEYAGWYYVTATNDSIVSFECGFDWSGGEKVHYGSGNWFVDGRR
jgi:hypothetical protein